MAHLKPCLKCGDLSRGSYCDSHKAPETVGQPPREKTEATRERERDLYNAAWVKLSKRARALQPYCTDCNTREDLSADHLPSAHYWISMGKPLTLLNVDITCRSCNSKRGEAALGSPRYSEWMNECLPPDAGKDS